MPKHYSTNDNWVKRHPKQVRLIVFVVVIIGLLIYWLVPSTDKEEEPVAEDEWCEIGVLQNGNLSYASNQQSGTFLVLARADGMPVLMQKCDELR